MDDNNSVCVSIIVPIYKVERYLEECILSVLNQSFRNYELILVDDGSPDNCGKICDRYGKLDERIQVIHQPNGGLSAARNSGLKRANGKYVYFLDPDDFLVPDGLSKLVAVAEKLGWPDYIKGNHEVLKPDGQKVLTRFTSTRSIFNNQVLGASDFLANVILIHPLVWNGLISRELIEKNKIAFELNGYPREDLLFHLDLIGKDFKGVYTDIPTYVYRLANSGSLSNTLTLRSVANIPVIATHIDSVLRSLDNKGLKPIVQTEMSNTLCSMIGILPRIPKRMRREYYESAYNLITQNNNSVNGGGYQKLMHSIIKMSKITGRIVNDIVALLIPSSKRLR